MYHGTKVGLSYYDFFIASGVAGISLGSLKSSKYHHLRIAQEP